jgi:penicillin amidase
MLYPFGETHSQWISVLLRLLQANTSSWVPEGENWVSLLEKCLAQTMLRLKEKFGYEVSKWSWGDSHQIEFGHALAAQRPFDAIFNIGPFVVGGDADTVCQMSIDGEHITNNIAPSFRQIIDTSNWDTSVAMHAPGQSGHLASPHYSDLTEDWLQGEYYTLNWSRAEIDSSAVNTIQFLPWLSKGTDHH